jgi:hypothetical protein
MNTQDILLVVISCGIIGSIAGVFAVRARRREQLISPIHQHLPNLIDSARRLLDTIKLARFSEFTTQESVEVAKSLGLDWHDESQWPDSDQQAIKLILITARASRVHQCAVSLEEQIVKHRRELNPHLRETLDQILAIGHEYLSRASHSEQAGSLHPDDLKFLIRPEHCIQDEIDKQLNILSMQIITATSSGRVVEQADQVIDRDLEEFHQ